MHFNHKCYVTAIISDSFMTLWVAAHQAPLSMEFSKQEYWTGLPCPTPGDLPDPRIEPSSPASQVDFLPIEPPESPYICLCVYIYMDVCVCVWKKKWKSCMTLCNPMDYTVHGILQARILEWVAIPFSRGSSQPKDRTQVSHIAGKFFTSWATREAQEFWSTLSLLQGIFLTQESNWGFLHCRWILYQLSYQGSSCVCVCV